MKSIRYSLVAACLSIACFVSCVTSPLPRDSNGRSQAIPGKIVPKQAEFVEVLPHPENLWIFLLAGQSNMAGRGKVEPEDTIPHSRILTVTQDGNWVKAKEPLHYYEPRLQGLDCGLAFAQELLRHVGDSIHIALLPCAVGGSSIGQWLGDSLHRGVRLLGNFEQSVNFAQKYGVVKGVLWHQGEKDAKLGKMHTYRENLEELISVFRSYAENSSLPVILGELGTNPHDQGDQQNRDAINATMWSVSAQGKYIGVVKTQDLTKHDYYHFDSRSLRILGRRYAQAFLSMDTFYQE